MRLHSPHRGKNAERDPHINCIVEKMFLHVNYLGTAASQKVSFMHPRIPMYHTINVIKNPSQAPINRDTKRKQGI